MADYLAQRIIDGVLDYKTVIAKKPDLKTGIDTYLKDHNAGNLIV